MGEFKERALLERHEVKILVRNGHWTTQQAEAWGKENGVVFTYKPDTTNFDPLALPYWSLEMAMVWIAWRCPQKVRQVWPEYRGLCLEWQEFYIDLDRTAWRLESPTGAKVFSEMLSSPDGAVPLHETPIVLRRNLESGAISATGISENKGRLTILNSEWCDLYFTFNRSYDDDFIVYRQHTETRPQPEYVRVRVPVKEMLREFPAHEADKVQSEKTANQPNLGAIWKDATGKNPHLTQTEAEKIAKEAGATLSIPKIRELWKSLYGPQKPGPKGPRKNRANQTA